MKDRKKFFEIMTGLGAIHDKDISKSLGGLYWKALSTQLTDEEFEQASTKAALTFTFFPKPGEILAMAKPDPEEIAAAAWNELIGAIGRVGNYHGPQFEDPRIGRTVQLLGGWGCVCRWTNDDLPFRRQEFIKLYKSLEGRVIEQIAFKGEFEGDPIMIGPSYRPEPVQGKRLPGPDREDKRPELTDAQRRQNLKRLTMLTKTIGEA